MGKKDSILDYLTKGKLFFALMAAIGFIALVTALKVFAIIFCLILLVYLVTGFKKDCERWVGGIKRKIDIHLYKFFK